jgi:hypothetical protein
VPRILAFAVLGAALVANAREPAGDAVARVGRQLAAGSTVEWEVKDVNHPAFGPIKFASRKAAVSTPVGGETILSQVYVSCQKGQGRIAIELSNAFASNPAGGLRPRAKPQLTCYQPDAKLRGGLAMRDMALKWEVTALGDVLTRGLPPAELRRCVSIDVLQDIALPPGADRPGQQVVMELLPYGAAIDAVLVECASGGAPVASGPPAAGEWRPARTITKGRTNLRAGPSVESAMVAKLAPGTKILVQQASGDWWKVKPGGGGGAGGYVRGDRLVFE